MKMWFVCLAFAAGGAGAARANYVIELYVPTHADAAAPDRRGGLASSPGSAADRAADWIMQEPALREEEKIRPLPTLARHPDDVTLHTGFGPDEEKSFSGDDAPGQTAATTVEVFGYPGIGEDGPRFWGKTLAPTMIYSPEPPGLALITTGGLGLLVARVRRSR